MDRETVVVLFRVEKHGQFKGEVSAVFPEMEGSPGHMTCYVHIGQHGSCSLEWMRSRTRPAKPEEYKDLAAELRRIGYDLVIKQRRPSRCRLG